MDIDFLNYGFIQRAFISGLLISITCSILGVFLVLKKLSLIGDGLAHTAFGAVAISILLKVNPLYLSIPLVMLSSLGIMKLSQKGRFFGDTSIGIVSSAGIAIGVLLASIAGGFNTNLFDYLFGNILIISKTEMYISLILSICVIVTVILLYNELLLISFDEELSTISGIKTKLLNKILFLLTAITVVISMKIVGIMLVSSLLILPAATSLQISHSFKNCIIYSVIAAVLSVIIGMFISLILNLPTGATIVAINIFLFMIAFSCKKCILNHACPK